MAQENEVKLMRGVIAVTLILLAATLRVLPHPWNLTPVGAIALFSGATLRNRWQAVLFPLAALFAGDMFIGFHRLMFVVWASFAMSVVIGRYLRENRTVVRLGGTVFLGAAQFFVITNFAVWASGGFYPRTTAGLAACYAAGVPFFWNTLAGDALYSTLLFGGYALAERLLVGKQAADVPVV